MSNPDYDQLWKDVITELFEEFLLFFAPDLYEQVDFTVPPQFLEQELLTIIPNSDSNKRISDKLVKLQLKNKQEQWVLVHIEVQSGKPPEFPKRMFQYFYRIFDLYDRHIYALALFTDEKSKYNENEFNYQFYGTKLIYHYNTYRIVTQSETELLQSNNPFSMAVLAGLYLIKSKKGEGSAFQYKLKLMRLLLEGKIASKENKRGYLQKLLIFIDHILALPENENGALIQQIKPLIEKEEEMMGLTLDDTSFAKYYRELGKKEGKAEGKAEGERLKTIEIAKNLLVIGMSVESICKATQLTADEVNKIKEENNL